MAQEIQDASDLPATTCNDVDLKRLQEWHAKYIAQDPDECSVKSISQDVNSDTLDPVYVEDQISQASRKTTTSGKFCNHCLHMFSHWPKLETLSWPPAVVRNCKTTEIEAGARQGCQCCSFLLQRLKEANLLDLFRKIEKRLDLLRDGSTASLSLEDMGSAANEGNLVDAYNLWLSFPGAAAVSCERVYASVTELLSDVVPPHSYRDQHVASLDMAGELLNDCLKNHGFCRDSSLYQRPTRLLCVANDTTKLVLPADWDEMPQYATLSYCWGTDEFPKLTPDNYGAFCSHIEMENLPQTFKDAILIARKLGIQYIWIDALCIVQSCDDNTDWLRESGKMRSVYGASHINIAAASATSVHEGCFSMCENFRGGFVARVQSSDSGWIQQFYSSDAYEISISGSHLASRAWTLQEKLLAPRTILFGEQGLFWECRSKIASEFVHNVFPGIMRSRLVRPAHKAWDWSEIVAQYSQANLSNPSDKLPALSGIARRQNEVEGDQYLAGIWRKQLLKQLSWQSVTQQPRPGWRAPTWSWASVDGGVQYWSHTSFDYLAKDQFVQVLNANTAPAGEDIYGAVTSGQIRLACTYLIRGSYLVNSERAFSRVVTSNPHDTTRLESAFDLPISMDTTVDGSLKPEDTVYLLPLFGGDSGYGKQVPRDDDDPSQDVGDDSENFKAVLMIRGLVLQYHGASADCYQRIGSFDYRSEKSSGRPGEDPEDYRCFMRIMDALGASAIKPDRVPVRSDTEPMAANHIITIV